MHTIITIRINGSLIFRQQVNRMLSQDETQKVVNEGLIGVDRETADVEIQKEE